MRVLVVEDNAALAANVGEFLEAAGAVVDFAYTGTSGLELARAGGYDAIVLDIALPRLDGLELCRRLREQHDDDTPILMLTARDTTADKLDGFAVGTDDYLTKPFDLDELYARLQALLRRRQRGTRRLTVADLEFDLDTRQVRRGGRLLKLTPSGLRLLEVLMQRAPAVVTRDELEVVLWGDAPPESEASLRVHLHGLRRAVDGDAPTRLVHTVAGAGYRIGIDDDA
ncbi:MAG: response regulator transcription factor [Gammaproteobacteria bacterium]|nr:response regulator transcription factor [Gammaproteobacteria bacterium]MCP5201124.1 response regulator transcription factor [Gammaproteobacteria bacterium]